MDDAQGPDVPAEGKGADDQSADRYSIGAQLSQDDCVQTFRATDRWLERPVVMVFESGAGEGALAETALAMTEVLSPNLVEIYERGDSTIPTFVVCELPMSTVASLVEDPDQTLWNEGWATKTAEQVAVALADLHRSGVEIAGLHFGYIGIDGGGRVRLSPWPLAEPPDAWPAPATEEELVALVLESGIRVSRSTGSSKATEIVASLPLTPTGDVPFAPDFLPAALTGLGVPIDNESSGGIPVTLDLPPWAPAADEPSVDDEPTGEVPVTPDFHSGMLAGIGPSLDSEPTTGVPLSSDLPPIAVAGVEPWVDDEPTGEIPVITGEVLLSQDAASPMDRGRHRKSWPLAAGACLTGLVAFLAFSLVSSNPPSPANASTNALKSPSSTIAGLRPPVTPTGEPATTVPPSTTTTVAKSNATNAASGAGGALPPVGTATDTTDAPSIPTTTVPPSTTTTTVPPSSSTTTVPPSTTTTTQPPPTTTTTAPLPTTTTTTLVAP
jgi:hypothetical protein